MLTERTASENLRQAITDGDALDIAKAIEALLFSDGVWKPLERLVSVGLGPYVSCGGEAIDSVARLARQHACAAQNGAMCPGAMNKFREGSIDGWRWVASIAGDRRHGVIGSIYKRERRRPVIAEGAAKDQVLGSPDSMRLSYIRPDAALEYKEDVARLSKAMEHLTSLQRLAIFLVFALGGTEEIMDPQLDMCRRLQALRGLLRKVAPDISDAVVARFLDNRAQLDSHIRSDGLWTQRQVAVILGITEGALSRLLSVSKQALAVEIAE
ncbi:hypothetical protein [Reyranella sp.]|uniref:hypothetical protein n=1 Tax=Reyranella sp. TaxID=1929291 RepID=UPI003BA9CCB6